MERVVGAGWGEAALPGGALDIERDGPVTMFVVCRMADGAAAGASILAKMEVSAAGRGHDLLHLFDLAGGAPKLRQHLVRDWATGDAIVSDYAIPSPWGQFNLLESRYDGSATHGGLALGWDGADVAKSMGAGTGPSDSIRTATHATLGSRGGQAFFFGGDIAEVIAYDRILSAEELAAVRAYAAARYSPGDSDWDGLPDGWESANGLDPNRWDSDLDGVADGHEDEEGDGMSVAEELLRGTDPGTADVGPGLRYALIDLGTNGEATAMSPGGEWVVGRLEMPGGRAFRWHAGQIEVFPTNGEAVAVNDSGAAAVNRAIALGQNAYTTEVVRWGPGGTDVVLNGDLDPRAFGQPIYEWDEFSFGAHDIGPDGTVCGSSTTTYIERWWGWENGNWVITDEAELVMRANTDPHDHWPCRWTQDGTVHLATPPGGTDLESPIGWTGSTDEDVLDAPNWVGVAWRINAAGRMAGTVSFDWYDSPVVRWTAAGCTDVPFTDLYMVIDLNDADELLVTDGLAGSAPGFELLDAANATLFSCTNGAAAGCNNRGDIAVNPGIPPAAERSVWFSTTNGPAGARRWERASVTNLLPAATLEDWGIGGLVAIGDNQAIAANATRLSDGKERPVLLLPVEVEIYRPETSTAGQWQDSDFLWKKEFDPLVFDSPRQDDLKFKVKFAAPLAQAVKDQNLVKYEFAIHDARVPENPDWIEINVNQIAEVSPDGKELWCTLPNARLVNEVRPPEPGESALEVSSYEYATTGSFIDSEAFDAGVAAYSVPSVNVRVGMPPPELILGNWTDKPKSSAQGTLPPWSSGWSKPFISGGGAHYLQVRVAGIADRCTVRNQVDLLYYSGHGHSEDGRIDVDIGASVMPSEVDWIDDLDTVIVAGCSVLDVNDLNGNYDDDNADGDDDRTTGVEEGPASKVFPGEQWATTGPDFLLGYNFAAPADSNGADQIIGDWCSQRAAAGAIGAWETANRNLSAWHACAIQKDSAYYYFHHDVVLFGKVVSATWTAVPVTQW